jgi:hypothetical protein
MEFLIMSQGWDRHLDEEQAQEYAMGSLSEEDEARCEEHLLVCDSCRQQVDAADTYLAAMKSATALPAESPQPRFQWLMRRPVWALGIALLVFGAIQLWRYSPGGAPVPVQLAAFRGGLVGATAPAGSDLLLFPDLTGLPQSSNFRLDLVDSAGRLLWSGNYAAGGSRAPRQPEGTYFVRIRDARGELLREYGLTIARKRAVSTVPQ